MRHAWRLGTERYLSTAWSHGGSERSRDGYGAVLEYRMLTHGGSGTEAVVGSKKSL